MRSGCVIGRLSARADCFTGDATSSRPRPLGRSGWVTTSRTRNPSATSFSSDGTAKRGVPQKIRSRGGVIESPHTGIVVSMIEGLTVSPLTSLHQLTDPALHQVAFKSAEVTDVKLAVQVIGLVEKRTGEQFLTGLFEGLAIEVLSADSDFVGPGNVLAKIRDAEAAFALRVLAFGVDDFRVDEDKFGIGVFFERDIDDGDAAADADLRRGEADAVGSIHRLEHVVDKLAEIFVEDGDGLGGFLEDRVAELYDGIDHAMRSVINSFSTAGNSLGNF